MGSSETRLTAEEIHENIRQSGEKALQRSAVSLLVSGIIAGLLIGFSFVASAYLSHHAPAHLKSAVAALGYPLGFTFVVLGRHELFTEKTLEPMIPVLHNRDLHTLRQMLRLWAVVLGGNLIGAIIFAVVLAETPMVEPSLHESLSEVARRGTEGGFGRILYGGIFAGWLIALLGRLVASTNFTGAQIVLIAMCTVPVAALAFAHAITGSLEAFYLAFNGMMGWGAVVGSFILPAVLGNIIGGVGLVALLNHGQVAS